MESEKIIDNEAMLTTFDNPFDPFEDFTSWWMFDIEKVTTLVHTLIALLMLQMT